MLISAKKKRHILPNIKSLFHGNPQQQQQPEEDERRSLLDLSATAASKKNRLCDDRYLTESWQSDQVMKFQKPVAYDEANKK